MKIAIVHDWLVTYAGAERVLEQILDCFPDAELFSMVDFLPDGQRGFIQNKSVKTSFIQNLPFSKRMFRRYLPLMPFAVERLNLSGYDLVISSSHAVAKGVLTSPDQLHICYLQARNLKYAYEDRLFYPGNSSKRFIEDFLLHIIRIWDAVASKRPDITICNSKYVGRWHKKTHGVESTFISPPVEVEFFSQFYCEDKDDYYMTTARLEPYKRIDLLVSTFSKLNKKLIIFGDGSEASRLKEMAGPNVIFMGFQNREAIARAASKAKAFVFAGREDFGIALIEALACGTPVIALGKGGAAETVIGLNSDHPTGVLFSEQSAESLSGAITEFENNIHRISPQRCREHAMSFSTERFRAEFSAFVNQKYADFSEGRNHLG